MPGFPELNGPLSDGLVSLRLYAERDIPEILIAYEDDAQLHEHLGQRRPPSGAELGRESEVAAADLVSGYRLVLTILEHGTDTCAGRVIAQELDWDNRHAELLVWVAPGLRRRGLGRRALRLSGAWLIEVAGLGRVGLRVPPDNESMLRAATAAGFTREGLLRSYEAGPRQRHDVVPMSLVAADLASLPT